MPEFRILVVEDEASTRDLLVAILEDDGYRVCAVADGATALDAAQAFKPDLALLDGGLSGIGGVDVGRRLRQACTTDPGWCPRGSSSTRSGATTPPIT